MPEAQPRSSCEQSWARTGLSMEIRGSETNPASPEALQGGESALREPQRHPLSEQGTRRAALTAGHPAGGCLFFYSCSAKQMSFLRGNSSRWENWAAARPLKGKELLLALLQVNLRRQKSPEGSVQEFCSSQTRGLCVVTLR